MTRQQARRDAIERALIHHRIDYSPPGAGQPKWLITTTSGRYAADMHQAEWYCRGLADAEAAHR